MKLLLSLWVVPLLAQQDVNFYTVAKERALGQRLASETKTQSKTLADPAVDAYVKRIGAELIGQLEQPIFEYQFQAIASGTRAEPFSLPGGYVFIPARSFVAAQDEAEFVGMLAHAIGHVALRHGTRTATRGQTVNMASVPLVFMGGWTGTHADSQRPEALVPMGFLEFQRTHELEADRFGLELAARAGYDATAFQRYVERTHSADSKVSPLPARKLRLAKIQETVVSLPPATTIPRSGEAFRRVQEVVRSILERPDQRRVPTLRR
ncbi:MAG: M48 family metalloprotease [Bryobacteraceae bacterium]